MGILLRNPRMTRAIASHRNNLDEVHCRINVGRGYGGDDNRQVSFVADHCFTRDILTQEFLKDEKVTEGKTHGRINVGMYKHINKDRL